MKRKLLYISFVTVISFTSMGFGFIESSTAMHGRINRHTECDSLKIRTIDISFRNSSVAPRAIQKPEHETITKSIIQWVADAVKNTVEKILTFVVKVAQSIVINFVNFFTK